MAIALTVESGFEGDRLNEFKVLKVPSGKAFKVTDINNIVTNLGSPI